MIHITIEIFLSGDFSCCFSNSEETSVGLLCDPISAPQFGQFLISSSFSSLYPHLPQNSEPSLNTLGYK